MVTNLVDAFESCTLPPTRFRHRDHVQVVWLYLSDHSLLTTLDRFPAALRLYAAAHGNPGLYHETITWALILLINERRSRGNERASWEEFAAANPDLFEWPGVLRRYYREETLATPQARRVFLLPDRFGGQPPPSGAPDRIFDPPG